LISFTQYLKSQCHRNDAVGDLAQDWLIDDGNKPRGAYKLPALIRYLERQGACEPCLDAGRNAWKEFEKARGKAKSGHAGQPQKPTY
jgi:uncharacterized protein YozE (UPF0346 family)